MKIWHPVRWRNVGRAIRNIRIGDAVCNPVYTRDTPQTRALADRVDAALASRGLRIDHPSCCVGFVEPIGGGG